MKGIDDALQAGVAITQLMGDDIDRHIEELQLVVDSFRAADAFKRNGYRSAPHAANDAPKAAEPLLDNRPEIEITTDQHLVNDATVDALATDTDMWQRGQKLVRIVDDHEVDAAIDDIPVDILRERITKQARFVRVVTTKEGPEYIPADPPGWCVKAVHARGYWPGIRPLRGITRNPVLRKDGSILQLPGYDDASGLLLLDKAGLLKGFPEIPSHPTARQIRDAVDLLLDVQADFPFLSPAHQAGAMAYPLTALSMSAHDGPAPLFLIDANTAGAGKGLLAAANSIIVTGAEPAPTP